MDIVLSPKIKKEIPFLLREYGYKSKKDFIEDALRHRILELKKIEFLSRVKKIQKAMKEKGIKEEYILKDFEKCNYQKLLKTYNFIS